MHAGVGKASFDEDKLVENVQKPFVNAAIKSRETVRPPRERIMQKISLSSTMGPGVSPSTSRTAATE